MAERKVNFIVAAFLLALTACGVFYISSLKNMPALDVKLLDFPRQVGDWHGTDLPMNKDVYKILGTDKVLLREYANTKGEKVWFAVVYGEQKRQSFHPPEYCYLGSGKAELLDKGKAKIRIDEARSMDVNKLIFQTGKSKQMVLYWFTAADKMTENYYKQQIYFVINQFKCKKSGGTLVRVSTVFSNEDPDAALKRSQRFIREALKLLSLYL